MLQEAGGDLQWLLQTTECAVAGLVAAFQGLAGRTDAVLNLAQAITDRVEDEGVRSTLPSVHKLGIAAEEFVGERLTVTAGVLETVTEELQLLRQLSKVTDGQASIAIKIKMLNISTKVEVAHLGSTGAIFDFLAHELADFSESLARNTEDLMSHTNDRKAAIEKTELMISVELPHLREEFARIQVNLRNDLDVLDSGMTRLSRTPAQFRMSAENIAQQIAAGVVAVQGHDITRQQIEHVQEALAAISGCLLADNDPNLGLSRETAYAHAGLEIQISQLRAIRATIAGWTSQIKSCMDSIFCISASDLVGIGPLVLEQERSLSCQISHIEALQRKVQAGSERIRGTLEGISNLPQLIAEHQQKAQSARNRLRLLSFNSIIEASSLGALAHTICVIADNIAEVSVEWTSITEQSGSAMQEILRLSGQVNEVMAALSQASSEKLKAAQVKTQASVESLRKAAAFAVVQSRHIETLTDGMQTMIGDVGKTSELFDAGFVRIDRVLARLEGLKLQMEYDHPGVRDTYDEAEIERFFSASYTTQTERDVLHAAIRGMALSVVQPCLTGNSVELF